MSDIVIVCPRKRKVVSTGLTTEMIMLESMREMGMMVPLQCPACCRLHYWSYEDAWVEPSAAVDPSPPQFKLRHG